MPLTATDKTVAAYIIALAIAGEDCRNVVNRRAQLDADLQAQLGTATEPK